MGISEIKNHPWTLGNSASDEELNKEFDSRKECVVELKALEAAEEKRRKMQANQNRNRNAVYRGASDTEELEFFKDKRTIKDYNQDNDRLSINPYKFAIEGDDDNIEFLNNLCRAFINIKPNEKPEIEASDKDSKFTVNYDIDPELKKDLEVTVHTLKIEVKVEKVEKNWYMVFFNKISGDRHEFYELFEGISDKFSKENAEVQA